MKSAVPSVVHSERGMTGLSFGKKDEVAIVRSPSLTWPRGGCQTSVACVGSLSLLDQNDSIREVQLSHMGIRAIRHIYHQRFGIWLWKLVSMLLRAPSRRVQG